MQQLPLKIDKICVILGAREKDQIPSARISRVDLKKGEDVMRRYGKNGQLETVICNRCGKKMVVERGILREGALMLDHSWDFFSEKDGEIHHLDLCEGCYDDWVDQFKIAVEVEEQTELL